MSTTETQEREDFEQFMARHVAQLLDFAKRYIGRLVSNQREAFLAVALEQAWQKRAELKLRKNVFGETVDILRWWEDHCLRPAALSRPTWCLRMWNGQREYVIGRHLGKGSP